MTPRVCVSAELGRMWPLKLDMTRDESRGMLRRLGKFCGRAIFAIFAFPAWERLPLPNNIFCSFIFACTLCWIRLELGASRGWPVPMVAATELDTYSSVMSTFRAQGALCKEKARILEELRKLLHISQDRHKAEARRVANDERLTTVAEM